ncbi:MAG: cyclic nucleotide-binding domain-containing protein [Beijerinckiaceae bacterium]|nr:cyclic nucleotide-binding domain-containing protein [Beijerinckiaceae bacterium]
MTTFRQFKKGELLFRQGDPSDGVLRVRSGEIEVLREVGKDTVLLGRAQSGEWLGEMGVIEGRSRSATARASEDGDVEILTAQQFLERVSSDPSLARDLILRLSIRLRRVDDKIAGDLTPVANDRSNEGTVHPALDAVAPGELGISLAAQNAALRKLIGAEAIHVANLPFLVGRVAAEGETKPKRPPDLMIEDKAPFRLSRQHFMLAKIGDRILASDLGSTLGTIVNGQALGHHFTADSAQLRKGVNCIRAGGWDSPFEFLVSVN